MSRLELRSPNQAQLVVEGLYKDLERRIESSPPGLCPVDMSRAFLEICHAQSCGKCVPCRVGLGQLKNLITDVLDGKATIRTLTEIQETAKSIMESADCAIGYEAANMVYKGAIGFKDDYVEHIMYHRCLSTLKQPVPCVSRCPARVDIPGYIGTFPKTLFSLERRSPVILSFSSKEACAAFFTRISSIWPLKTSSI